MNERTILIIGAGNMGCSLASGLIHHGWEPSNLSLCESQASKHSALSKQFPGSTIIESLKAYSGKPTSIILAVKPHDIPETCKSLSACGFSNDTLYISIAAGISTQSIKKWLGKETEIVRCMPNTPASIGMGITGLYTGKSTPKEHINLADSILQSVGMTVWVNSEQQLDAVTAVSGSGPAYLYYLMECLQDAGQELGLSNKDCYDLTLQTMLGAAQLAKHQSESFETLRNNVTSKGGTTEHAIKTFEKHDFKKIISKAINAAFERAATISKSFDD